MMKKMMLVAVALVVAAFTMTGDTASAADPKTQIDALRKQAIDQVKFGLEDLSVLRTEVNKMKKRQGSLTKKDKELEDRIIALEAKILEYELRLNGIKDLSPEVTLITRRIEKLEHEKNGINSRLDTLEREVDELKVRVGGVEGDVENIYVEVDKINDRMNRGLGVKLGIATYTIYGTSGSISGGASLRLLIPASQNWEVVVTGGFGGSHEGASGFADVAIRHVVSDSLSVGVAFGIDANCDGMCTRLLTEIWGAGPDMEFRFADGWFLRGRILLGSEWQKLPTKAFEDEDGNMVYQTNDSRDFGVSGFVGIGHEF